MTFTGMDKVRKLFEGPPPTPEESFETSLSNEVAKRWGEFESMMLAGEDVPEMYRETFRLNTISNYWLTLLLAQSRARSLKALEAIIAETKPALESADQGKKLNAVIQLLTLQVKQNAGAKEF